MEVNINGLGNAIKIILITSFIAILLGYLFQIWFNELMFINSFDTTYVCDKWVVETGNNTYTVTRAQSDLLDAYYSGVNVTPTWHYDENKTCLQYVKIYIPRGDE